MALTYSTMLELGTRIPDFKLKNVLNDNWYHSSNLSNSKPSLVMIICNHCPYVVHYHSELQKLQKEFSSQIDFVAISSNDVVSHPQDGPEEMVKLFNNLNLIFPYLYDETQEVAKLFKAECTPEFYLFSDQDKLVYRGRLDESSPRNGIEVSGSDLRDAMNNLLTNKPISKHQYPSMGCNIKWK